MTWSLNPVFALLLSVFPVAWLSAAEPPLPIAPYVDDQVLAVARLDVGRLDVAATLKFVETLLASVVPEFAEPVRDELKTMEKEVDDARKAGLQEVYAVVSLADVPMHPPLIIAVRKPGSDPQAATRLFEPAVFPDREVIGNFVLLGAREQVQRARAVTARPRPDLVQALADGGPAVLKAAVALTPDSRRVIREMLAPLPAEFGGLTGPQLADGLQWVAISVDLPPKPFLRVVIQAREAAAAKTLAKVVEAATGHLRQQAEVREVLPQIDELVRGLRPTCEGDRLTLTLEQDHLQRLVTLLTPALRAARGAAEQTQSSNNLKQIALAMHMYHDEHKCFPAQASCGPDGTKLLSWRVHLLPYLDQDALYRQFHLNEPWDSAHNRTLIAKLPSVFVSPRAPRNLAAKGLTTYLVPVGEKTVFAGREGTPLAQITDGTSNTILFVEAAPSAAVIWTRPDDLAVDRQTPRKGLTGQPANGFLAAFCDGSVRFLADSVEPETLRRLFQMNDGQPVQLP